MLMPTVPLPICQFLKKPSLGATIWPVTYPPPLISPPHRKGVGVLLDTEEIWTDERGGPVASIGWKSGQGGRGTITVRVPYRLPRLTEGLGDGFMAETAKPSKGCIISSVAAVVSGWLAWGGHKQGPPNPTPCVAVQPLCILRRRHSLGGDLGSLTPGSAPAGPC